MSGQTLLMRGHWETGVGGQWGEVPLPCTPFTRVLDTAPFSSSHPPICLHPLVKPHEGSCFLTQEPRGTGLHDAILGRLEDGLGQRDGVTHHGTVEPILSHHAAPAPALLPLPPLGPAVLEPNLGRATRRDMGFFGGTRCIGPLPAWEHMHACAAG